LAICRFDEHVRVKVLVRREGQVKSGPLLPLLGLLGVPCPDDDLMTGSGEGLTECPPDRTRSQNGNLHGYIMNDEAELRASRIARRRTEEE
jgi:hypothetical protein